MWPYLSAPSMSVTSLEMLYPRALPPSAKQLAATGPLVAPIPHSAGDSAALVIGCPGKVSESTPASLSSSRRLSTLGSIQADQRAREYSSRSINPIVDDDVLLHSSWIDTREMSLPNELKDGSGGSLIPALAQGSQLISHGCRTGVDLKRPWTR